MAVFRLQPRLATLDHPAWAISWHSTPCYIVAETIDQARKFANCAFIVPLRSAAEPGQDLPLPWSDPDLVEAWRLPHVAEFGLLGAASVGRPPQLMRAELAAA
ncbi:hypothetical protein JMJ56_09090 [Belnapia sp. T18]|uniref:Uncharacterized protein n=1 Tax=Belnapia arida TaxID=2804533 RepID=A0ABS1U1X7_9PROT|nr:hypothetical protein [Belnapia arida]MBL6078160.1 hypothetical protein [Belnapia arida]